MGVKAERTVESEMSLTFVKYPAPKGPNQVVVSMFRDVIDKKFHRDQIEGLCPPLVKLPQKSKQVPRQHSCHPINNKNKNKGEKK